MSEPSSTPVLRVQIPGSPAWEFPLDRPEITIGRAPGSDLLIKHRSVSRQHARIFVEGDQIKIEDLGSANGTRLGEIRLTPNQPMLLPQGQPLQLGNVSLSLQPSRSLAASVGPRQLLPFGLAALGVGGTLAALALFSVVVGGLVILGFNRQQRQQDEAARLLAAFSCPEPAMPTALLTAPGGEGLAAGPVPTHVPGGPYQTLAFLELPFPYDGGNQNFGGTDEQFRQANQRNGQGGRINSFFDHYLPLYPAPKDPDVPGGKEPAEEPVGGFLLSFDGSLSDLVNYSGHPGYDYSVYEYRTPSTPLFAAADGVIYSVGEHSASGALFVKLVHTVEGVGNFMTVYWHLHPDYFFEAMLGREGEPVAAGTRIGTMGNTGFSTGHHLHFEVRFDANQDDLFSLNEVLDPYGYVPSPFYPVDPWTQSGGVSSPYLWKHPLGTIVTVPETGGGSLPETEGRGSAMVSEEISAVCAQPGTLPAGSQVYWSLSPGPYSTYTQAGDGTGCVLSVFDSAGRPVERFNNPVRITIPFDPEDLDKIDPNTLAIHWQESGSDEWVPLETTFDYTNRRAAAFTDRPGHCALLGAPTGDLVPPTTEILISGPTAPDQAFYDIVTVTLQSSDLSGIQKVEYSLDGGTTWKNYTGPFSVEPYGIPRPVVMNEPFFGGLPGTNLILAAAVDSAGNREDPPAYRSFSINPTKDPERVLSRDDTDITPVLAHTLPTSVFTKTLTLRDNFGVTVTQSVTTTVVLTITGPGADINQAVAVGPNDFPDNYNPLTGLPCENPELLALPPALVSVTNFPASARPQAGLSFAPFVFELYIGEGMTRFLSMFYCEFPQAVDSAGDSGSEASVGPIRSGRLPYESLRKLYDGFLVMAGASAEVGSQIGGSTTIFGSDENDINSALIGVNQLEGIARASAGSRPPPHLSGNRFDPSPPTGGLPASKLWIFWNNLNQVLWEYSATAGGYLRYQDNADATGTFYPASDRLNGEHLTFQNVIVLFAEHTVLNSEKTIFDIGLLFQTNLAYLFRDGQVHTIYWTTYPTEYGQLTGKLEPIQFVDRSGNPVPLAPGSTWVEMVDLSTGIWEIEPGYWKVRFYNPSQPEE